MGDSLRQGEDIDAAGLNRRWRPALIAYFQRRVKSREEAEDLTQEVFIRLLRQGGDAQGQKIQNTDGYVFTVAAHLLADRARRAQVRRSHQSTLEDLLFLDRDDHDPHRIAEGRAELSHLIECLENLPLRQRTIFVLYRFENMSQEMISEAFGISISAVKKQIAKTMAYLLAQRETGQ